MRVFPAPPPGELQGATTSLWPAPGPGRAVAAVAGAILLAAFALALPGCGLGDTPCPDRQGSVLLVGIDGLSWNVLLPLVREGRVPHFEELLREGIGGRLATLEPTLSPVIWTTIATGRTVEEHGITHFVEKNPKTGEQVPFTSNARRVPAIWNLLSEAGRRVGVVGWWITWPAERVNGIVVSSYSRPIQEQGMWKGNLHENLPHQTYPEELFEELRPILQKDREGLAQTLSGFLPRLGPGFAGTAEAAQLDQSMPALLADQVFTDAAAYVLRTREAFDFFAVYLNAVDVLGHRFWRYYRPGDFRYPVDETARERLGTLIPDYVVRVDALLGRILERGRREGTTVIVVSDHGMHAAADAIANPLVNMTGHHRDAPDGVILAAGPLIRRRAPSTGTPASPAGAGWLPPDAGSFPRLGTVYDITPTILYLLGAPVARDFHGSVLGEILRDGCLRDCPPTWIDTYLPAGPRERERSIETPMDEGLMEQLRQLGYIE